MSCGSCGNGKDGTPSGCQNNGHCSTGGCSRLNTFDWLSQKEIFDPIGYDLVEISYKNGARKDFCSKPPHVRAITGDNVVIDEGNGYNVGRISLSGDLVRLQMKKKGAREDRVLHKVVRRANHRDLDRLLEARDRERGTMVKARAIARTLDLDMKIGDVEFRGDNRKATFYYTADGRVDFRELVRHYAQEFRVKVEMRQIGARQESGRIGGLGSCGRELCCSTWLTDFKSVSTTAARYQNLSINQTKLSGQCGRLKCCLNYELESYLDALKDFPKRADRLKTEKANAVLVKTDIFKKLMYYAYETTHGRSNITAISVDRVKEIMEMNKAGEKPEELLAPLTEEQLAEALDDLDFGDVTGVIELPMEKRRRRGGKNRRRPKSRPKADGNRKEGRRSSQGNQQRKKQNKSQSSRSGAQSRRHGNASGRNKDQQPKGKPNQSKNPDKS